MDFDVHLKEAFERDGYLILENFFTEEELAGVEEIMARYVLQAEEKMQAQEAVKGEAFAQFQTKVAAFGEDASKEQSFIELGHHQRMHKLTNLLLGENFDDEGLLVMVTPKGNGQAWHRDCYSENPKHFVMNRLIYSRDITPEQGALILVPRSHRLSDFPPGGLHESMKGEVIIAPKKGTLAMVHTSLFHRVNPNETDLPRYSINYRVRPTGAPAGLTKIGIYRTGKFNFSNMQKIDG